VIEYRLSDGEELARVAVGAHPTEMVWLPAPQHEWPVNRQACV
jgi:hypothetical protein